MNIKEYYPIAKARYDHDCESCRYLGRHNTADLYFCDASANEPTVVARFSSTPSDYVSGLEFANEGTALYEAKKIAKKIGLLVAPNPSPKDGDAMDALDMSGTATFFIHKYKVEAMAKFISDVESATHNPISYVSESISMVINLNPAHVEVHSIDYYVDHGGISPSPILNIRGVIRPVKFEDGEYTYSKGTKHGGLIKELTMVRKPVDRAEFRLLVQVEETCLIC